MEKTREEFVTFLHVAMHDQSSSAYIELYSFLVNCFCHADPKSEGKVYFDRFHDLIEEAAALPRKYGYAPTTASLYKTDAQRNKVRQKQFDLIDVEKKGYLTLDQWIKFCIDHIYGKCENLPKDYLNAGTSKVSKDEFKDFIRKAVVKGSSEYRQLYQFLLYTFQAGDVNHDGRIDLIEFDKMIETAAAAPRRFGFAPQSRDQFPNPMVRMAHRKKIFEKMDVDNSGTITFDEWLKYAVDHIAQNVPKMDKY